MKNNIYLIGMMGSGKSTIGKLLAKNIYYKFIDVDDFIVNHSAYESINEIFEQKNEEFFRTLENDAMKELSGFEKTVIATGGGVILNKEHIQIMHSTGIVIYLESDIENLVRRLKDAKDRPLLKGVDLEKKLERLFNKRERLYSQAANLKIDISAKDKNNIIERIIKLLEGDYDEYISD